MTQKNLTCFVYVSNAINPFTNAELKQLVNTASSNNEKHDITGYLYYFNDQFLQYVEGPKKAIEQLQLNLKKDSKHHILNFFASKTLENRRFPGWFMGEIEHSLLMELKMEHVLIDYISWFEKFNGELPIDENKIWSMVDKLSKYRKQLSTFKVNKT